VSTLETSSPPTVERHPVYDYPLAEYAAPTDKGAGWIVFAALMLGLGGIIGVISGIVAVADSSFYVLGAKFVFSDLNTWGWIVMTTGAVAIAAAVAVPVRAQWARWSGILVAGLQAIAQILMIQAYPMWSLCIFALDVLVIYALAAYGGKQPGLER
jgi:hypothetical protein